MVVLQYATSAEIEAAAVEHDIDLPGDTTYWGAAASNLVNKATMTHWYSTDPVTGLPTDDKVAACFRDAAIAQIVYWAKNGVDPEMGAGSIKGSGEVQSSSIGGGSITKATANNEVVRHRVRSLHMLVPMARLFLPTSYSRPELAW